MTFLGLLERADKLCVAWPYFEFTVSIHHTSLVLESIYTCYVSIVFVLTIISWHSRIMQHCNNLFTIDIVVTLDRVCPVSCETIVTVCDGCIESIFSTFRCVFSHYIHVSDFLKGISWKCGFVEWFHTFTFDFLEWFRECDGVVAVVIDSASLDILDIDMTESMWCAECSFADYLIMRRNHQLCEIHVVEAVSRNDLLAFVSREEYAFESWE